MRSLIKGGGRPSAWATAGSIEGVKKRARKKNREA